MNVDAARRLEAHRDEAEELSDDAIDALLGLSSADYADAKAEEEAEADAHPGHSVVHVATPYARCRELFTAWRPTASDVVFDLGCGIGRVVLYGAHVCEARFVGVEIVPRRARVAELAALRAGLERVEIVAGSALDVDLSRGTMFFLFRPFSPDVEAEVVARLTREARTRPIAIGAFRLQPDLFDRALFHEDVRGDLRLLRRRSA